MDVRYLDVKPVLRIVDEATHFITAKFLPGVSTLNFGKLLISADRLYTQDYPKGNE